MSNSKHYIRKPDERVSNFNEIFEKYFNFPPEYVYNGCIPANVDPADYLRPARRAEVIA